MAIGVTIVICTYNGARMLPDTLAHIAQQRVPPHICWEVIVVDNASTDDTSEVVKAVWAKSGGTAPFTLLHQPKPGLTYARELALESARYEYIIFCDDDNWLAPDYVSVAYELMQQHPSIGALGGHGELVYETPPPAWAAAMPIFANGRQASKPGKVYRNAVYGAGCVIRKSAYMAVATAGFEPMLTDRVGANLSSGGDYEFCYALALIGYDIWYDPSLRFRHFMPRERMEWGYYERFFVERAKCFEVLVPYQLVINAGARNASSFYRKLLRLFLSSLKQLYLLLLHKFRLPAGSDDAKTNTLKLMSVKARLWSFSRHRAMRRNFAKILQFKREKLVTFTKSKPGPLPGEELEMRML